jgi:hypothetical protein
MRSFIICVRFEVSTAVTMKNGVFLDVTPCGSSNNPRATRRNIPEDTILHKLYSSPSIITIINSRRMRWAGYVARMGEKRNVYRLLVRKPEGKRPPGRPRRRWIDNIKMDLLEIGLSVVGWISLAQDRCRRRALVNSVMSLRVP